MPTTATYLVTKTAPDAQTYRVVIEITGTTNGLDEELFVFETLGDGFVSVATRQGLEIYPRTKQEAIDDQIAYYRGATVQRDFYGAESAEAFITASLSRVNALCLSIDRVAAPFGGTASGTVPPYTP